MAPKFALALLLSCSAATVWGQATFTTVPSNPTAEDSITVTVNVSGVTSLEGDSPLYAWFFKEGCCGSDFNGSWEDSNERFRMTDKGNNRWEIKFKPTTVLNRTPAELGDNMGFLVKAKNGNNGQTSPNFRIPLESVAYNPQPVEFFPRRFSENDIVTVTFDFALFKQQNPTHPLTVANPGTIWWFTQARFVDAAGNIGDWQLASGPDWPDVGASNNKADVPADGKIVLRFISNRFFVVPTGSKVAEVKFNFRNQNAWVNGQQEGQAVGDIVSRTLEYPN